MAAGGVGVALKGSWEGDPGGVGQSCVATMVVGDHPKRDDTELHPQCPHPSPG